MRHTSTRLREVVIRAIEELPQDLDCPAGTRSTA